MGTFVLQGSAAKTFAANDILSMIKPVLKTATSLSAAGSVDGGEGAQTFFRVSSTAADSTFDLKGAPVPAQLAAFWNSLINRQQPAQLSLAIPVCQAHVAGAGFISSDDSSGEQCSIQVFGIGKLDLSEHNPGSVQIGSIEGDGNIFLGALNLTVGANDTSTTFSGLVQDGGADGAPAAV